MSLAQQLLAEFEQEANITRKFLERLPADQLTWKPHQKSMNAGQLALHLATVPYGVLQLALQNPGTVPDFSAGPPQPSSPQEVLAALDRSIEYVRTELPRIGDTDMESTIRLVQKDGTEVAALPRAAFLRAVMFSHWIQHRGQFSVYLRMLDIAVPSSYGPSADEKPAAALASA
jgi:uncharacterized damage-inducible protein DinB